MLGFVPSEPVIPTLEEVIADLRVLRERGMVRLRHTELAGIGRAAAHSGLPAAALGGPAAVEALIRAAVDNLGGGSLGTAATATFGLARGTRDMPAQDRRRRAAMAYRVSVERFRKHHERIVIEQVAEEILKLCSARTPPPQSSVNPAELATQRTLTGHLGDFDFPITIHIEPIELLSDIDILVVPENVYLELPQAFKASVSAAVRRAAATRAPDGEIVIDVISNELRSWIHKNGREGLPVAAGTVVATSAGAMAEQGILHIYHAAVVTPRLGTNEYDVEPTAIATSVRNALNLARAARQPSSPQLRSIGFPLLGSGRGGLDPATSFAWLWAALERDIRDHGPWNLHFVTNRRVLADLIVTRLREVGVTTEMTGEN